MQCLSDAEFRQLADGTGPSERSEAQWRHVDGCDACTERMGRFVTDATLQAPADARTIAPGSRAASSAWMLSKGDTVGRYVVLEPLGAGGMGEVYAAFDSQLDRKVALKLLRAAEGSTGTGGAGGDDGRARLLREAQAMARLTHPNVVTVHEVGQWRDQTFLSMELVEGGTHLRTWLEEAPRPWREVVRVLLEAGRGLAAAHAAGLVHRDFKPDNVLLGRDGHVRVTDFGLARTGREPERATAPVAGAVPLPEHSLGAGSLLGEALTQAGAVMGTPGFMAPEQYGAGALDARADQFSFCASLYYCLYRQRPFAGTSLAAVAEATRQGRVSPPPRDAHVPGWLHRVVLRGLSARPDDRFPAMEPLLAALQTDPSRRTRRGAAVAAVALALGGGLAVRARAEGRKAEACASLARPFSEAWSPDAQAEVERAFQATGVPFAADASRGVQRALGAYAEAMGAMARDACLATRVRGEASERVLALRSACLGQRRGGLEALARVFARADRQVVEKAAGAAAGLEPLAACADVDWLTSQVQPPPGPQAAQALAGLRDVLAQARAEHAAGQYAQAVDAARKAVEGARAVPFMPLEAEALVQLGASERAFGKPADAEPHLQQAVVRGLAAGLREVPVRAAAELVGVAGAQSMERAADVQAWHQLGRMVADRTPVGMERPLAALQSAYGAALVPQDRFDEAEAAQREALAAARKVYPEASWEVASIYSNLGSLLFFKGQAEAALPFNQKAVELAQEVLGDSHPSLVRLYMDLGNSLLRLQRGEEAAAHYQRAHDIATRALPPEHPSLSAVYNNLGRAMITLGRHADAERYLLQDLALSGRLSGEDSVDVNITLQSLLRLCILTRQDEKCRPYAERALRIAEGKLPPQHSTRLITLYYVGSLELESGRLPQAVAHFERALAQEARAQPAPGLFGNLRFALAQAYWKQGRGKGTVLPLLTEARARMLQARRQAAVDELTAWTTEQGLQLPEAQVRAP